MQLHCRSMQGTTILHVWGLSMTCVACAHKSLLLAIRLHTEKHSSCEYAVFMAELTDK